MGTQAKSSRCVVARGRGPEPQALSEDSRLLSVPGPADAGAGQDGRPCRPGLLAVSEVERWVISVALPRKQ